MIFYSNIFRRNHSTIGSNYTKDFRFTEDRDKYCLVGPRTFDDMTIRIGVKTEIDFIMTLFIYLDFTGKENLIWQLRNYLNDIDIFWSHNSYNLREWAKARNIPFKIKFKRFWTLRYHIFRLDWLLYRMLKNRPKPRKREYFPSSQEDDHFKI